MSIFPPQIAPRSVACKCCKAEARIFGVVDFNQNCESRRQHVLDPCGIPIYYHRCQSCGFLFTVAFDSFSQEDFAKWIYNSEYHRVDPDYDQVRPHDNADRLIAAFGTAKDLRILDYGGGAGRLSEMLRGAGFLNVDTYDPFVAEFALQPQGRYDLVTSYEVVEHSPDPAKTFEEMNRFMKSDGIILLSTVLQPADIMKLGMTWWYIAPRNGHVSILTPQSLELLAASQGLKFASLNVGMHVLARAIPPFAQHLFGAG